MLIIASSSLHLEAYFPQPPNQANLAQHQLRDLFLFDQLDWGSKQTKLTSLC